MFLPWEKLTALILGPLMICVGVFLLVTDTSKPEDTMQTLTTGVVLLLGGTAIFIFGVVEYLRKKDQ